MQSDLLATAQYDYFQLPNQNKLVEKVIGITDEGNFIFTLSQENKLMISKDNMESWELF